MAVDAAPPSDADKSVISERMLIMLAEALEKKRPSIKREVLVGESHSIAIDQKKLPQKRRRKSCSRGLAAIRMARGAL